MTQNLTELNKVLHPCDVTMGRRYPVYVFVQYKDGRLSLSGVIGPTKGGDAQQSGQIDMSFAHRNPDDNMCHNPIQPSELAFQPGWTEDLWLDLLDVWKRWHINDMRAECGHQRAMGWQYKDHHNPQTSEGEACPVCGYRIGSAWLREEVPQAVLAMLASLPDADQLPPPVWLR
jgi:hypothetical protein